MSKPAKSEGFFAGSLGCLTMLFALGGIVYVASVSLFERDQEMIASFSEGAHTSEVLIKDIDRVIRHTSGHYSLLKEQGDQPVKTIIIEYRRPKPYRRFIHNNEPKCSVYTDVEEGKPWAIQRFYKNGGESFELHLRTVKSIEGGEHHYRVKIQKHWHNRVQESDIME